MKYEDIAEVLDFLNSIEGHGYGGMASFEIARAHMLYAYLKFHTYDFDELKTKEVRPND